MAASPESVSIAMFCDFENVALGVRDAKFDKFDIKPVLERLLLKGSIVVKKAYCDWERYKGFKAAMLLGQLSAICWRKSGLYVIVKLGMCFFISSATTVNPFPESPALAASIAAFNASKFI